MVDALWLLDTNIVSEPAKADCNPNVLARLQQHEHELAIPSIVLHELRYGWLRMPEGKKKQRIGQYLQQVVTGLPVLNYDAHAARLHAQIRSTLEAAGKPLPFADGQIAAIAISHGLTLVTRNTKDFAAIPNLQLANWFAS